MVRRTTSIKVENRLYGTTQAVGRHLAANGHDVDSPTRYAVAYLVSKYIRDNHDEFDKKAEADYVFAGEVPTTNPLADDETDENGDGDKLTFSFSEGPQTGGDDDA